MRICIEGNIGAGKSTVFESLCTAFPEYQCFPEPLSSWGNYVDLFYADPKTWALPFSLKVLVEFSKIQHTEKSVVQIVERSPLACRSVFTSMLKDDGIINAQQWDLFKQVHDILGWAPDGIVYVKTPPDTCLERVRQRARACEAGVDIVYLKRLEHQYNKLLATSTIPRVEIDGSMSSEHVAAQAVRAVAELSKRLT
jgi:deoxyadenosine/deoxycytidine kinase